MHFSVLWVGSLGWLLTGCPPTPSARRMVETSLQPSATSTPGAAGGLVVDPRVQPAFDEFVEKCRALSHSFCLDRLRTFRGVRVGAAPVETFSGKGPFPGGVSDGRVEPESTFINADEIVVPLAPFVGKNLECYGRIYLFHALGHALLGWRHPEAESNKVRFSNTSLMGYETYPICLHPEDNLSALLDDLFAGRLRTDVSEGSYQRGPSESPLAYSERLKGFILRIPERGQLRR